MFKSATFRLTVSFLGILMFISLFFSVLVYRVSSREFDRSIRGPVGQVTIVPGPFGSNYGVVRDYLTEQAQLGKRALVKNLFFMNIGILMLGGVASYVLARYTLKPIEEAHEAQSRFTADASHELRTPLAAMRTEIEVALRDPKLSKDEIRQLLQSNLEELDKLTVLSDGLLRLARLESNNVEKVLLSVNKPLQEAIDRVIPLAETKRVLIEKTGADAKIYGDESSLTELFTILIDNAVKYSPDKSSVKVTTQKQAKSVMVSVIDQGQGIKATELEHIFERFYRADSSRSKKNVEGYGLGLSIAKSIADMHDAKITASSKPGKGSTFSVKFT